MTDLVLPRRLIAPSPGWTVETDVIVVGSGVAGLTAALHARRAGYRVHVVTKGQVNEGSTRWAQGGIAAALDPEDSPEEHFHDTLVAGAGLCDEQAVRTLVTDGPDAVRGLIDLGAVFDQTATGSLSLTREGGHLRDRIIHAGGDATGAEVSRALVAAVAEPESAGITLTQNALVLDLLLTASGAVAGLTVHVMGEGQNDGVGAVLAPAIVLATGGIGQVFSASTNPSVATGDGIALAMRAGAEIADLEFVQFHPTVMWLGSDSVGQQPLISEALRGEGAILVDDDNVRFMVDQHPLGELAPRDVVAKGIMRRMRQTGADHMWLDARRFGQQMWETRFPTILASLQEHGLDPVTERIPVAPAQHYLSGGVRTDREGRTSVPGLFACGECACTGVHGANRLASNSLLEGLVFAERIGSVIKSEGIAAQGDPAPPSGPAGLLPQSARRTLQEAMTDGAGVLRSADSLAATEESLRGLRANSTAEPQTATWETTNLHAVASVLARAAALRTETRGSHWREDYPERNDVEWRARIVSRVASDGEVQISKVPVTGAVE